MAELTREIVAARDAEDPLAPFRRRFAIPDESLIYLDGNSLGRPPSATAGFVAKIVTEEWGTGLVRSWSSWIDWARRLGDLLGTRLLGADEGEVIISDSTSVNLYKLAAASLAESPGTILFDVTDFPTDRYVVQGLAAERGLTARGIEPGELGRALDEEVGLVVLSLVNYRTGELLDMARVNAMAREAGARVLWDLSHAVGAVPVRLTAAGAELAVGCTYKHLNAGPGAPAFLYVHRSLQTRLRQPIWGWFGQRDQFVMGPDYHPVEGIERFLVGTPPILSLAAIEPALNVCVEAGIDAIRDKSVRQSELIIERADRDLVQYGISVASPRDPAKRGGHVCLRGPGTWQLCQALARDGVVCDFRVPDLLRLAPAPLYTRFADIWDAMDRLRTILELGTHHQFPTELSRVT
ncbi:MAG TPA: kynureninase [Amycolatopsis sp.]|uniref:kynureninase n=1 Tax=Amycolatopsis sp. TaxID=37632 RepID=UPI002B48D838|nr:kynureninase [Amycolatopsis sp.]HKS44404.1 kynureninase [Amycolatopsis sp.]